MSVHATTWVWDHAQVSGNTFVVLLAIADAANSEGENSCQSVATLARMGRCSESTVHRALKALRDAGLIEQTGVSERYNGTSVYRIPGVSEGGVNLTGGVIPAPEGVSLVTPEPTTNPTTSFGVSTTTSEAVIPERHGARRMIHGWIPSSAFRAYLRETYPHVSLDRRINDFVAWNYSQNRTSNSWEAALETWVSRDEQQYEQNQQNGTNDLGIPLNQSRQSVVPGPAQPGDPNYYNPNED